MLRRITNLLPRSRVREEMGTMLGRINVETPKYKTIEQKGDIEIREYEPSVIAEVTWNPNETRGNDVGFMTLADYIGVFGKPSNKKGSEAGEKIAMTAPVITQEHGGPEKIAMTAPVITEEKPDSAGEKKVRTTQFVLPSKYTLENAPTPTNERVKLKATPVKKYGVLQFSGTPDEKLTVQQVQKLKAALQAGGYKIMGEHMLARYNPPWTPSLLKTNEVMIPVE